MSEANTAVRISRTRTASKPRPTRAQRATLERIKEQAGTFDNLMFGEMFAEAAEQNFIEGNPYLWDFIKNFEAPPVSIETFLDSDDFIGATDIQIWPEVREAIIGINKYWWRTSESHSEALLMGATSTGKTEIAKITTAYHKHLLGSLRNPQAVYGLPKTTSIVTVIMAAKPHVTKRVVYTPLRKMFEIMPWFQKHMRVSPLLESEIYFEEKNIRIVMGGADSDSILGEAIVDAIIDEINFMNIIMKSKKAEVSTGRAGVYDQAATVYEAITRRKDSRFISRGPSIGVVCVSSSTRYKGDFTDKRKKEVRDRSIAKTYVYDKKQWEVWPSERYCGDTFRLLVGNDVLTDTRVLADDEQVPEGSLVLETPIEYREAFLRNPHDALRDIVGMSTSTISPFFRRRFKILEAIERGEEDGLRSFLYKDNVILGVDGLPRVLAGHYCQNPSRPRYVHIDLSISGDRCGVAMVRFDGLMDIQRHMPGGEVLVDKLPTATVEMAVSIEPDANNEISIAEIRSWVKQLKELHGYPIKVVTYDGFESAESRQQWKKEGMRTGLVSVDKTSIPYKHLRDCIADGRMSMYNQEVFIDELFSLEFDEVKDKVDHQPKGSKDIADAVCGAYNTMLQRRSSWMDAAQDDEAVTASRRAEYDARYEGDRPL